MTKYTTMNKNKTSIEHNEEKQDQHRLDKRKEKN